ITVEMKVQAAKDRLEKRGEIYLDAELNFRDEKSFAVIITKAGAASLKEAGITDPAAHFMGKTIFASGEVKLIQEVPRIEIDDARLIRVAEPKRSVEETTGILRRVEELDGKATLSPDKETIIRIHLGGTKAGDEDLALIGNATELLELSLAKTSISD